MDKGVNADLLMDKINGQKGVNALEGLDKWALINLHFLENGSLMNMHNVILIYTLCNYFHNLIRSVELKKGVVLKFSLAESLKTW